MLLGTTAPDQSGPGSNGNESSPHSPDLEPYHKKQFSVISRWGDLTTPQGIQSAYFDIMEKLSGKN